MMGESAHCVKSFPTQRFSVGSGLCGDQSMCENNLSCSMKSLFWLLYAWAQVALRHPRTARLSAESICCWQRQCRNYVILYYVGYSCLCCCWSISKLKWNQVFKKQKYSLLLLFMLLFIFDDSFFTLLPFGSISCSTRQPISIRWAHRLSKTNNKQLGFWKKS